MQFGKVLHPETIDFHLPEDHTNTTRVLQNNNIQDFKVHIGCAKWNRQDLKGFYPRGTRDELNYYSSQFNAIELNATFYNLFPKDQFQKWYSKTSPDFKFYPKLTKEISHEQVLDQKAIEYTKYYIENVSVLEEKLGCIFLQMHEDFDPQNFQLLENYLKHWPQHIPLAVELRHTDWFNTNISSQLYQLFENYNITNIITDTAGRRDLLHMALTSQKTFIRFVGANHITDYSRLDEWSNRLDLWKQLGASEINFFVHQNTEIESVKLAAYFIKKLNSRLKTNLKIPRTLDDQQQLSLF